MSDNFLSTVKGALLHDIGKVIQRADDNPTDKNHREWGYEWLQGNLSDDVSSNPTFAIRGVYKPLSQ